MPELPEVENVRLSLLGPAVGRQVVAVQVHRPEVVTGDAPEPGLLRGETITGIDRHGKQLALRGQGCVCVHLGMTGSLCYHPAVGARTSDAPHAVDSPGPRADHVHVIWQLDNGGYIAFRDPRRFGGIWAFASHAVMLQERWGHLGPDALTMQPRDLHQRLSRTTRGLKQALLDQRLIAGLGNIYVDELLFTCGLHPLSRADRLDLATTQRLTRAMRRLLAQAIKAGGSTLRDYVDARGQPGAYQQRHQVYGRAGEPCRACGTTLASCALGGRTTVWCPHCQPRGAKRANGRTRSVVQQTMRHEPRNGQHGLSA